MNEKNVVLIDYEETDRWEFKRGLEDTTKVDWEIKSMVANKYHKGYRNIIRYAIYLYFPLKYVFKIKEYKNIIAWQQFFGLILSGYLKLFHIPQSVVGNIYIMEMIYKPKKGFIGKLYKAFVKYAITSKYIKKIFVFSANEKNMYSKLFALPCEKFEILQLGIADNYEAVKDRISDDGYYLSPGRSNRDWDFLVDAWDPSIELRIVCDDYKGGMKPGVDVLKECYKEDYLEQLLHCHAIIIPLMNQNISSGQLVILQGKMLGKPVIVTDNYTVREYLNDEEDGYIIEKHKKALQSALEKLGEENEYNRIVESARRNFQKGFSIMAMGRQVGQCIIEGIEADG
ncbi:MAG: glycosyltransferase family 4 protein [Clostridia bacterium]|nr:glycosyltransferase family 4 protein [Clostridia bacterium]